MRSEEWERIRRRREDLRARSVYTETYDSVRPWMAVVRDSARDAQYWTTNVKDLVSQSGAGAAASAKAVAAISGVAAGASQAMGMQKRGRERSRSRQGKKQQERNSRPAKGEGRHKANSEGVQLCFAWNRGAGGCATSGNCPSKRAHPCEGCLGPHRTVDEVCQSKPQSWPATDNKGQGRRGKR